MATTWRLLFKTVNTTNPSMAEFVLAATPGGPSLLTGGTAGASSEYNGSFVAANAFDGNLSTLWSGVGNAPQWLQYSPTTAISPVELRLTVRNDGYMDGNPFTFDLQNDKDTPGSFVTVQSYTAAAWSGGQTQTFAVANAASASAPGSRSNRYWRFTTTANVANDHTVIETITMATVLGGANLITAQASCSAQSFYSGDYNPGLVVAGVAGLWSANEAPPSWWQYDLGAGQSAAINNFTVTSGTNATFVTRAPTAYTISSSADGVTFTNEWSGTFPAWTAGQTQSTTNPAYAAASGAVIIVSGNFAMLLT